MRPPGPSFLPSLPRCTPHLRQQMLAESNLATPTCFAGLSATTRFLRFRLQTRPSAQSQLPRLAGLGLRSGHASLIGSGSPSSLVVLRRCCVQSCSAAPAWHSKRTSKCERSNTEASRSTYRSAASSTASSPQLSAMEPIRCEAQVSPPPKRSKASDRVSITSRGSRTSAPRSPSGARGLAGWVGAGRLTKSWTRSDRGTAAACRP